MFSVKVKKWIISKLKNKVVYFQQNKKRRGPRRKMSRYNYEHKSNQKRISFLKKPLMFLREGKVWGWGEKRIERERERVTERE